MMNWIAFWEYLTPSTEPKGFEPEISDGKRVTAWPVATNFSNILFCIGMVLSPLQITAQTSFASIDRSLEDEQLRHSEILSLGSYEVILYPLTPFDFNTTNTDSVPEPKSVMRRSLFIPGWGQVTNKQIWKVPVIYGLFAGMAAYTIYTNDRYKGYRAAYYNSFDQNIDLRFGPTPGYIPAGQPPELYRSNRNNFRNQRDLSIIGLVLIYGLNVADAYIFAQLRDFDVSDNLSGNITIDAGQLAGLPVPNIKLTINFTK